MTPYTEFLEAKRRHQPQYGHPCSPEQVHADLYDWQRRITAWAVRAGRAALWEHTGLGKTRQQLEWARLSAARSLIVAPLAVCQQTIREAAKIGIDAAYVRSDEQASGPGVWVTNYEMALRFDPHNLGAVVLDEASILKQHDGKTRRALTAHFVDVPSRLTATATPAPNDVEELCTQAEYLGVMPRNEMLAAYFVHDADGWRLKGHARRPMFDWMSTWAVALRSPADLGYPDDRYRLPPLDVHAHLLDTGITGDGLLFGGDLGGVGGRAQVRRTTLAARVTQTIDLIRAEPGEPWIIWCGLNAEADALAAAIPGAVNVPGSWSPEQKAEALLGFADGQIPVLITKTSIAGFGMNYQHCARMVFCGLSDSWESYYQAIRRCWRYGQSRPVDVHVVLSDLEKPVLDNVLDKEQQATALVDDLITAMQRSSTWTTT